MSVSKKILIICLSFGVVILLLLCFLVYPFVKSISLGSKEIIQAKKDLVLFQKKNIDLQNIGESYYGYKDNLDKIEKLFVDPKVPVDLIEFWEKIASDSEIFIDIAPASLKVGEDEAWKSISFQIRLVGSFSSFMKFFEKIETSPYLVEIKNLSINRIAKENLFSLEYGQLSLGDVNASLVVKVYVQND